LRQCGERVFQLLGTEGRECLSRQAGAELGEWPTLSVSERVGHSALLFLSWFARHG
jgi:hypothetical protein